MKSEKELLAIISKNLKEKRAEKKLSQLHLATMSGVSQSYIGEIEAGRKYPSLKVLNQLSNHLEIKPHELLLDKEIKYTTDINYMLNELKTELKRKISFEIDNIASSYYGKIS